MVGRRRMLAIAAGSAAALTALTRGWTPIQAAPSELKLTVVKRQKIKVGLLWSLTGHLSVIEKPSRDVALFWIDEANRNGGVAGIEIEPVTIDTQSDMKTYREGILKLMREHRVLATFGGYTSASRRAIMPLVTEDNGLFYYPTCYEGRECWQNIICTGPIANQHSFDLIPYMVRNHGNRAYFIGSNYVWARESNRNASRWLSDVGGELVGERYVPLGSGELQDIMNDVKRRAPDWIFSTVVGDSDIFLRREYARAGFAPDRLPTASLTTSELEVRTLGAGYGEGHILCAPYFQSLRSDTNARFVESFLASRFGESGVTHYNMEETYLSFQYFRKAVELLVAERGFAALTPPAVRNYSGGLSLTGNESPEGEVRLDPDNFNSWLKPKIGRFNSHGQIDLLWQRDENMAPAPYLLYPSRGICLPDGLHLPDGTVVKAAS